MNTPGDWKQGAPGWPGAAEPAAPAASWAVGLDTLARASSMAATATDERVLRTGMAHAITGPFADWVFVDVLGAGPSPPGIQIPAWPASCWGSGWKPAP
ncbi:MAG TPA: hypothetical protein VGF54_00140 [Streptosporangiaceae bacterium]|jgi:hypothetical protein